MERLTKKELLKKQNGKEIIGCNYKDEDCDDSCMYGYCRWNDKALKKLKEYEDLEEQGLLCRLALKPNDTVYVIFDNKIYEAEAVKVVTVNYESGGFTRVEVVFEMEDIFYCDGRMMKHGANEVLGEKVFLTMEEAELKLKNH